jgi:LAGLIDADG endonuclease
MVFIKKGKYISFEVGIELSIRDMNLINKIKKILGVGIIGFRKRKNNEMVYLRIKSKKELKKYIIPIFDKYPMLSNKQYDYLRFREILFSNIIYYSELSKYTRSTVSLNTVDCIINISYFSA